MVLPLYVEVVQCSKSYFSKAAVKILAEKFIESLEIVIPGKTYVPRDFDNCEEWLVSELRSHVKAISICDLQYDKPFANVIELTVNFYVYKLENQGFQTQNVEVGSDLLHDEEMPAANHWDLPSQDFYGLWESLYYDSVIKKEILRFIETTLLYSDNNIDPNLVILNRVLLLHGPPGTGKTSLCKAIAQKLSIRLGDRYTKTQLVEINSHSLFSKWFSESGKLVMKLFDHLHELAKNPYTLICVLIDEVESLTHARTAALSGSEPSDSIRVVNAVLTQLDLIKQYPNVFIMTTSNITGAIDLAFVDRAGIKQFIGPPSVAAIYQIYLSSIQELATKNMICMKETLLTYKVLEMHYQFEMNVETDLSLEILALARNSHGLSGRTLRQIPLIAHALYTDSVVPVDISDFINAMNQAITRQKTDNEVFFQNG